MKLSILKSYRPYSMAFSGGRAEFLRQQVYDIIAQNLPGDFVECGVWRGGNCMLMAHILKEKNEKRKIWMYDTYEGMPDPGPEDVKFTGERASDLWYKDWCRGSFDEVKQNMKRTGYPHYTMIKGKVEDTIPSQIPSKIALLRLDTDFYQSTKHELVHLFPLLNKGGVLIIDDYKSWKGSRQACDEFFNNKPLTQIGTSNAAYLIKDE